MPKKFAKYELVRELGRGAQAVVYEARDTTLDRTVALKVLLPGTRSDDSVRRFEREARAAARLNHENVIAIYEVGEWQDRHYLTMELVEGDPLDKRIAGRGLPVNEAISIAKDVALAVQAAHDAGIIHRDIKPGNILIEKGGKPKLTDFGLALDETAQAKLTRYGAVVGTVVYLPPEQAKGETGEADARSDIYSLGAVLYEMMTGRPPFRAVTSLMLLEKIVNEIPKPPSETRTDISRDAETIALKCLEKDPGRRYQTARELADDCASFLAGEPISARPASALHLAKRGVRRHKGALLAALALAVIVGLGAWVVHLRWTGDEALPSPPSASGAGEKLREIRAKIDPELNDYATVRTALEAFASFFPDAQQEISEAEGLLEKVDGDYAALAEKALAEAEKEAAALAKEGDPDDARAKIHAVRELYPHGPWLAERGEGLVALALTRIDQMLALKGAEDAVAAAGTDAGGEDALGTEPDKVTRLGPPAAPADAPRVPHPARAARHGPRPTVLERGLVGWWKFDERLGTTARDSSGTGNDGKVVGAAWVRGRIGGAISFDGIDDRVIAGVKDLPLPDSPHAISLWARAGSVSPRPQCVAMLGDLRRRSTVQLGFRQSRFNVWRFGGQVITRGLPAAPGAWHHYCYAYDGTTHSLFFDGLLVASSTIPPCSARPSTLVFGDTPGFRERFCGAIDDVRLYGRALSAEEIGRLAAMGGSSATKALVVTTQPAVEPPERNAVRLPAAPDHTEAARRRTTKALSAFDAFIDKGDYAGARRAAEAAAADPANADAADVLRAAARVAVVFEERSAGARRGAESRAGKKVELRAKVGTRRGTVDSVTDDGIVLSTEYTINTEVREKSVTVGWGELSREQMDQLAREGGWKPGGADAQVALAYLARGRRDAAAARRGLRAAGGHPLASHVRERIEAPGRAAAETEARAAWARIEASPAAASILSRKSLPAEFRDRGWLSLEGAPYRSYSVAFSPDGRYVAAGGYMTSSSRSPGGTTVGLWSTSSGKRAKALAGLANYVQCVAFSSDGKRLAGGGRDGSVVVWDVSSGNVVKRVPTHTPYVLSVAFSPDGRYVAAGSRDGTTTLWDVSTGGKLRSFKGRSTYVYAVGFSPDGRWLAAGGSYGAALWALPAGVRKRTLSGHSGYVKSVAFSSNGRYLVTGSYDTTAILWNVSTGARVRTFEGHGAPVYSVALSSDGRTLATGCGNGTVVLWDCSTSRRLRTFSPRAGAPATSSSYIYSVAMSPDCQYLATGGHSSVTRIWLVREKAKLAPEEAKSLIETLVAFEEVHGRTKFAKAVAEKFTDMMAAAIGPLDK